MLTNLLIVALLAALLVWFVRRGEGPDRPGRRSPESEVDHAELEAAEREVRDLRADLRPEEGFEGDDWGPGAPRPPVA